MARKTDFTFYAILFLISVFLFSCSDQPSEEMKNQILGDYQFVQKDMGFVLLNTVYEKDGAVYIQTELADYPVLLKKEDESEALFSMKFKKSDAFGLKFSKLEDGKYRNLEFWQESSGFKVSGQRVEEDVFALRELHKRTASDYSYRVPLQLNDGLLVANNKDNGIDQARLLEFMNILINEKDYMHSILIIKNGKLVLEEYLNGWDPARLHRQQSVTKSITSILVGIAVREGFISSIEDPIYIYLTEYESLFDEAKKKILIKHLLNMSAGFEWNEAATYYVDPEKGDFRLAEQSDDYIKYVIEKPLVSNPGEKYYYNSGYPNILGYIIQLKSGMSLLDFAYKYLFDPLGIRRSYWAFISGENRASCAGGLRLISRDMAKIGLLYLNKGLWNGNQIIPAEWIEASTQGIIKSGAGTQYGYLWKRIKSLDGKINIIYASGTGGQYIIILPEKNAVVITTAKPFTKKSDELAMLLLNKLIPVFN